MSEQRDSPKLEWSGERYVPEVGGNIRLEHVHRYLIARELSRGKKVLDIACGEGYGSAMLAAGAANVIGVDIAADVVEHAARRYPRSNLEFKQGSCDAIPLADQSVEVVVSFETLEHVTDHQTVLREIRRVLCPRGLLLISTPDRREYTDVLGTRNEYHLRELDREEFRSLLQAHFRSVALAGQRILGGSLVATVDESADAEFVTFSSSDPDVIGVRGLAAPLYLLAVASDGPLPVLPIGLLDGGPFAWASDLEGIAAQGAGECAKEIGRRLDDQFQLENATPAEMWAAFGRQADRVSALAQLPPEIDRLRTELAETRSSVAVVQLSLVQAESELVNQRAVAAARVAEAESRANHERAVATAQVAEAESRANHEGAVAAAQVAEAALRANHERAVATAHVAEAALRANRLRADLDASQHEARELAQAVNQLRGHAHHLERQIQIYHDSLSWRMTAPVRAARRRADRAVQHTQAFLHRTGGRTRSVGGPSRRHPLVLVRSRLRAVRDLLRGTRRKQARAIRAVGLFDAQFYLSQLSEASSRATAMRDPLGHFLSVGGFAGLHPHPLFDSHFYLERNQDVGARGINPLWHFIAFGGVEERDPHPLFSTAFYLDRNPDVAGTGINPLVHYLSYGAREGRDPNAWFDTSFYVERDPALRESAENPLAHYLRVGAAEGRPAGPSFDTKFYLSENPDVTHSGLNPLIHYILAGRLEGRHAVPISLSAIAGDIEASIDAYRMVSLRARQVEQARIRDLVTTPPPMIALPSEADLLSHAGQVMLRNESLPQVSIAIPVMGGIKLTLECLLSISRCTEDVAFEVIVVDNGSEDDTARVLSAIPHLRYLRHDRNLGFGRACNAGAEAARAPYVVFLNNDTQVQRGWLAALLRVFLSSARVGAVGPKVVFPDGRLQDAGSLVNADCSSSLVGVFDDPDLPRFNRLREADYLSGVCLMVETQQFRAIGGFSDDFSPAYCEDIDLCLRLRRDGFRMLYQPAAVIVHHLSASSLGISESFKMTAVRRNQQKLSIRHQSQIESLGSTRIVAFYVPAGVPPAANEVGEGQASAEWRSVANARPNFEGHYQPREPADLGYYDGRLQESHQAQVKLAERYGISGFCYYYDSSNGIPPGVWPLGRTLERETDTFPFCLCWARENGKQRSAGLEAAVGTGPSSEQDEAAVVDDLVRRMSHPAQIRIDGRPLLLIHGVNPVSDVRRQVERWRGRFQDRGLGDVYLAVVECPESSQPATPLDWGFDASVEFPPSVDGLSPMAPNVVNQSFTGAVFDYNRTAVHYMTRPIPAHPRFRGVMPGWDSTPRCPNEAVTFAGSTPGAYQAWLEWVIRQTREQLSGDERIVFVNAWNEWTESAYLEPDLTWGHGYLEATQNALDNARLGLCSV